MKLAEAIILGDSLKKRDASMYVYFNGDDVACGCALGGALLATGFAIDELPKFNTEFRINVAQNLNSYLAFAEASAIQERWPWLTWEHVKTISYMYSDHESAETIAEYVRSIEPQETGENDEVKPSDSIREYSSNSEAECATRR